jgi:hypothetical protein
VSINGFKPMPANDVDRLDMEIASSIYYTRAYLVGVPSYYTELYGDRIFETLKQIFSSIQGNHVLCIPNGL